MTFGFEVLLKGFDFLIAVIGLFGIGEILLTIEEAWNSRRERQAQHARGDRDVEGAAALLEDLDPQLFGGLPDGHRPGRGHARLVHELRLAKKMSRDGEKFGTGMVEGVVAPETAAHAAEPPRCCR